MVCKASVCCHTTLVVYEKLYDARLEASQSYLSFSTAKLVRPDRKA